ncbi:MAG: glycosyltransferase [Chlamydiota bacterium]|jgi:glycosyltransferase involved in cell wall biosynthesis
MSKKVLCILFFLLVISGKGQSKEATVCLNMIVKDEKDVIEKCLSSVKPFIDYWVIFDTGSTDGTQKIIKNFLKDIPGELHESKWVNFQHNRNEALQAAKNKGDYLLFIDADEVWKYSKGFKLPELTLDCYQVVVRHIDGGADFKRVGLINNHIDWKWHGVLHEDILSSQMKTKGTLDGIINICNESIGARSKDPKKYLKDAKVLEEAFANEPNNSRYAFYIAQAYLNADELDTALKKFEKRLSMPSEDEQETYLALYQVGMIYTKLNRFDEAIDSFSKAYNFRPTRAEPLFRMAICYRKKGNFLLGYLLSKFALSFPYPKEDVCVETDTYSYAALIEYANCALLLGRFPEGLQACKQLLDYPNLPANIRASVISNYELASKNVYGSVNHDAKAIR